MAESSTATTKPRPDLAWRSVGILAGLWAAVLIVASAGYGYHRDELYFLAIGRHPAFGYVDQPPLVPLLAHAIDAMTGHSLVWLRVPSAIAGALIIVVTALIAREFGASRTGQLVAAAAMGTTGILIGASHLMSTTPFDLLAWTVLTWLIVRAISDGGRWWVLAGLAAGVSLEIKTLPAFLLVAVLVGLIVAGPREVLTSRSLWLGSAIALALWAPNLIWEATHHWPQLKLSASIASGKSGSSQPRALFVPFQFLLVSPPLAPVWIAGLWRLARDPRLQMWRCLPVAYVVLVVIFIATGGKPYYLCGLYPALFAAGAEPTLRWVRAGRSLRRTVLTAAVVLSAAVSAVVSLPVIPSSALHDTPVLAMNYDAGEQIGWHRFVAIVGAEYDALPASQRQHAIVLGENYGEAGAMLRYRPDITHTYSGQNSMWDLGPPPGDTTTAVVIGYDAPQLRLWFATVRQVATIDNGVHLNNDEQGRPVWLCTGPTTLWPSLWPKIRRYA